MILIVDAAAMAAAGHTFYRSANGVWLTDEVPTTYLRGEAPPTPDPRRAQLEKSRSPEHDEAASPSELRQETREGPERRIAGDP
ncbi:hypothetical protein ACFQZ4_34485 [Catellatospora coxensis]